MRKSELFGVYGSLIFQVSMKYEMELGYKVLIIPASETSDISGDRGSPLTEARALMKYEYVSIKFDPLSYTLPSTLPSDRTHIRGSITVTMLVPFLSSHPSSSIPRIPRGIG